MTTQLKSNLVACACLLGFGCVIALGNLGRSFWALSEVAWFFPMAIGASVLLAFFAIFLKGNHKSDTQPHAASEIESRATGIIFPVIAGLISLPIFWYFRQRFFGPPPNGNGDSLFLIEQVPVYTELFGARLSFDEILELYTHSKFYLLCKSFGVSILDSYAALSCFTGALYVGVIANFLRKVSQNSYERMIGWILLLLTPAIGIFCGYVEHYDTPTLFITIVLILLISCATCVQKPGLWVALGILSAVGALFHMMVSLLIFPLLAFTWISGRDRLKKHAMYAGIPAALILGFVWLYFFILSNNTISLRESFFIKPPFYPFKKMLSVTHLLDQLNLLLLAMPAVILLPVALLEKENRVGFFSKDRLILSVAFTSFFTASFLIHPLLDFPSDWDLFTLFAVPGNLLLWTLFKKQRSKIFLSALIIVCAASTAGWVLRNARSTPESQAYARAAMESSNRFLAEIKKDSVYQNLQPQRRKTAVLVKLFFTGAEAFVSGLRDQSPLSTKLQKAKTDFDVLLQLPDPEYEKQREPLMRHLTDLNIAIEELKKNRATTSAEQEEGKSNHN